MEDKTRVGSLALSLFKDETCLLKDEQGNTIATILVNPKQVGKVQLVIQAPISINVSRGVRDK